jgi:hypothetical protein
MTAAIGQQHLMTGQISAIWNIFLSIPMVGALLVGGWLSGTLEEQDPDEAHSISSGCCCDGRREPLCYLEAKNRLRWISCRAVRASVERFPEIIAPRPDLPCPRDMAFVELRTGGRLRRFSITCRIH